MSSFSITLSKDAVLPCKAKRAVFRLLLIEVQSTLSWRPPPVSDHLTNNPFVSQFQKKSLVNDHYLNFLSDRDQFIGQKFDSERSGLCQALR